MKGNMKGLRVVDPQGRQSYISPEDIMLGMYSELSKITLRNPNSAKDRNPTYAKYTKEEIVRYLESPANYEKQLRQMSIYMFNVSNYYRRLIEYLANMSTFSYVVVPYSVDHSKPISKNLMKKQYYKVTDTLEKMNIPHEFSKALTIAFRDDVYYGYVWETDDSFSLQNLDADYCKICSIEDGCYNFAFDFSYFASNEDKLPNYPAEFSEMYELYKHDMTNFRWQELDSTKSICLKVNEHSYIPIPPFVSLFSALADIEDYRSIAKNASESNNYKAFAMKLPINEDDGKLLIDFNDAKPFYDMLCNATPPNIGVSMSPFDITALNFDRSGAISETNDVADAEASMWSEAGVNKVLFGGGEDPSASTLSMCTINDQMIIYKMMRQIARWINRKLKSITTKYKFKINFLEVTHYNQTEMHNQYLKDGQYGLPVRTAIMATQGFSPADTENISYLENEILGLADNEIPLTSANVQSGDGGRPTNSENGIPLSESGEITADRQET